MNHSLLQKLFILLQYLTPHHILSRLVGWVAASEIPWVKSTFIHWFKKRYQVDLAEAEREDPDAYTSFNDFFTRALKADARPVSPGAKDICCPADGAISQIGRIRAMELLQAKGHYYSLFELIGGDAPLASEFQHGSFATIYLSPRDYHRVHMPVTGTLREMRYVPGKLFSVNPLTTENVPNLFARNERMVAIFDTDAGPVGVVMVGAMIVAGIETVWAGRVAPPARLPSVTRYTEQARQPIVLNKGDELGRFLLGSTVILLFPEHMAALEPSLSAGSAVRMGEKIGQLKKTGRPA